MKVLVLGTSSDAGKTVVAAMICRHLARKGLDPAPFKASNLSLNSYATIDGGEIGIGQAFQAWACGIEPESDMNPVLMKPSGDGRIQIVLGGKPYADVGNGVRLDRDVAREQIMRSFSELSRRHGSVICEGSGSPAELNLLNCDLANTGLMRQLGIPAILVGDIERGGVFAAVYGTWRLIPDDVRPLLRGFVINRFRGDPSLLTSGIEEIERRTGMKCLGVLPYMHLRFPEEDSLSKSEGRFEGDDPHAAFVSNVDCMLDAAIESGFDFETLEKIGGRSSPGCDAEDLDDRVLGQNGVHGHGPPRHDVEERVRNGSGAANRMLDGLSREGSHIPVRHTYRRHAAILQAAICDIPAARGTNRRLIDCTMEAESGSARNINYKRPFTERIRSSPEDERGKRMNSEYKRFIESKARLCESIDAFPSDLYEKHDVKKGLRDSKGNGVIVGLTSISQVDGTKLVDGVKKPCEGMLRYRGYSIQDLTDGFLNKRFGFEECTYLLLFGELPTEEELEEFRKHISEERVLPVTFTRDVVMKAANKDIMNSISRCILFLASYDKKALNNSIDNVLRQCIYLISVFPMLAVYSYHAYNHYINDGSMYIHRPDPSLSSAENLLRMLRPDKSYTKLEATVLDLALVLHMEHGGGNNSTFTTRVTTSAGSDTYAVIAAAMSSLKGPKHGGANLKVMDMMADLKRHVKHPDNEQEIAKYLNSVLDKKAFDHQGLVYGMGHAVYTMSDPRAEIFRHFVKELAAEKGRLDDYHMYAKVEEIAPPLILSKRRNATSVCANVDFYSGFVYDMLGIPKELYTPLFATARIVGWSAHRMEELITSNKILRPAYVNISEPKEYVPLEKREP